MEKPFSRMQASATPWTLSERISARLDAKRRNRRASLIASASALEIGALAAVAFSVVYVVSASQQSGISSYLSLIFTDGSGLLSYSRELALSLVESLPVIAVATVLAALAFAGWASVRFVRQIRLRSRAGSRFA